MARYVHVIMKSYEGGKDMLRERYDLVTELHEEIIKFKETMNIAPQVLMLSPSAFEWLIAIFQEDKRILGVSPIDIERWTYDTGLDVLQIVIDEMMDDCDVKVL